MEYLVSGNSGWMEDPGLEQGDWGSQALIGDTISYNNRKLKHNFSSYCTIHLHRIQIDLDAILVRNLINVEIVLCDVLVEMKF